MVVYAGFFSFEHICCKDSRARQAPGDVTFNLVSLGCKDI